MKKFYFSRIVLYIASIFFVSSCKNEGEVYINKNLNADYVEFWLSDESESKIFSKETTGVDTGRVPVGTFENIIIAVSYTHLTLPTTPYV